MLGNDTCGTYQQCIHRLANVVVVLFFANLYQCDSLCIYLISITKSSFNSTLKEHFLLSMIFVN